MRHSSAWRTWLHGDLSPEDRAQIEEAVAVVRRSRTVMLGMPKVGQPLPDVRPWRSS